MGRALKVSVAVPVLNEESSLPALLDSLLSQTVAPDEIVLADGGSTDGTGAVARRYADRGVRLIEIGPAYPGRGRNHAIASARNEWVALIDAGCQAEPRWIEALIAPLAHGEPALIVLGHYEPRFRGVWEVAQALAFVPPVDLITKVRPPFVASSLLHKSAWTRVGGFPEDLRAAEDLVFFERLAAAGIASVRAPDAVVRWNLPATPAAVFRRLRLYSRHHLAAGLLRTWHSRVMCMDVLGASLLAFGVVWPTALVLLLLAILARTVHSAFARRGNIPGGALRLDRLGRVTFLLLLSDLATWAGAWDHALDRLRRRRA